MVNRKIAPGIITPESVDILHFNTIQTKNDIHFNYINTGTQEVIRVSLVFCAGTKYQDKPFLASSVVNMIAEGSKKYTSEAFSEKMDFYGLFFDQNIDRDYSVVTMCCLERFLKEGLELLGEAVCSPRFDEHNFEVYKNKRKQSLTIDRQKISVQARELFGKVLFGENHPYGVTSDAEEYNQLTTEDLRRFHAEYYSAQNCFCVATGTLNKDSLESIKTLIEILPKGEEKKHTSKSIVSGKKETVYKDDSLQSSIRVGRILFSREHPDFIPMQILSVALGGYFGSRLIKNIREDKGYTYGIFAGMINLQDTGYLAISTEVAAEYTEESVTEIFNEINRLKEELIPEEELKMVKNVMIGEVLRVLDGPFGINDVVIENIQNKTDNHYLSVMIQTINQLSSDDLLNVARKYLSVDDFSVVIVGKFEIKMAKN